MNTAENRLHIACSRPAFSLAELIAALTIGAMVLVAVLGIYGRAVASADAITRKIEAPRLAVEVLQRIAEDLDRIVAVAPEEAEITFENKFDGDYQKAKLTIVRSIEEAAFKTIPYEEIVWQTGYDLESDANALVLYRSYNGMAFEDRMLDQQRETWEENYPLVPICEGVTFFQIQAVQGGSFRDEWAGGTLVPGLAITISFAHPVEMADGTLEVPEEKRVMRIIAVDRTREIKFKIPKPEKDEDEDVGDDPNDKDAEGNEEDEDGKGPKPERVRPPRR